MKITKSSWSYEINEKRKEKLEEVIEQFNVMNIKRNTLSEYMDVILSRLIKKQRREVEGRKEAKKYQ